MMFPDETLPHEGREEAKRELIGEKVRDDERAPLRLDDAFRLAREQRLHIGLRKVTRELFPERSVGRFRQLEDFSAGDAFRDEAELFRPRKLRRVLAFHEARERFPDQACSIRAAEFGADKMPHVVVEAVRQRERRTASTARLAAPGSQVGEEFLDAVARRCVGERRAREQAAVIVRATREEFSPRLRVRRCETMLVRELVDSFRR